MATSIGLEDVRLDSDTDTDKKVIVIVSYVLWVISLCSDWKETCNLEAAELILE